MKQIMPKILNDIKVDLADEFDKNFERKAFFDKPWKARKFPDKGSLLNKTGNLRKIHARVSGNSVVFSSDTDYAALHNYGGEIPVTKARKKFFWAMYYKTKKEYWKGLALKPVGSMITIPQRQFLGWHPSLQKNIDAIVGRHVKQAVGDMVKRLNKR